MNKKILFALLFSFFITEFSFSAANAVSAGAKKFGGSMAAAAAANYAAAQVGAINNQVNKIPVVNQQIPGSFPPARRVQFNDQPKQSIQNITNNKFNRSVLMDNQDELQGSSGDSLLKSVIDQGSVAKALADQQRANWKPAPPTTPYPGDRKVDDGLKSEQQVVDEINYVVPSKPAYSAPVRPAGAPGKDTTINDRIEEQRLQAQALEKLDKQIAKNQAATASQFNQAVRIKEDIELLIDSNSAIFNETNQDFEMRKVMDKYTAILSDDASWANEPLEVKDELLDIKKDIQNIIQSSKQKHLLEEQSVPVVNQSKTVKTLIAVGSEFGSVGQQSNREQYVNVIHQPIQKSVEGTMEVEDQVFEPKIKKIAEPVSHKIVYTDEEITAAFMESIAFSELIKKMFMAEFPQGV